MSRFSKVAMDNDTVLLVDRESGKWLLIPESADALLDPLLRADNLERDELPSDARRLLDTVRLQGLGNPVVHRPKSLTTLILKLTKVCNYRCKYCYDMEPDDTLVHLPYDVAMTAIREALHLVEARNLPFDKPDLLIILHGGEPTLFFELIKQLVIETHNLAEMLGKRVAFVGQTNGSRIDEEFVRFSTSHNISWGISLDGRPALNDRLRVLGNGDGTYSLFERALERFPEFVKQCNILSTVTALNQEYILEMARYFRDLGMRSWDWSIFQAIGMGREHCSDFGVSLEALVNGWNQLFAAVLKGEFQGFSVKPVMDYVHNFILGPGSNMCMRRDCGAARDLLSLSSDGTVSACDCIDRKGPLGILGLVQIGSPDSLKQAMNSAIAATIRSRDVTRGKCNECTWLPLCGGTCLAHADEVNGVYETQCVLALNAFPKIANSVSQSNALRDYWNSLYGTSMGSIPIN